MEKERILYKVLVVKPEGKRPLGRPRRRWYDGNRMDLREIMSFWSSNAFVYTVCYVNFNLVPCS
jgi:hypothetical protein